MPQWTSLGLAALVGCAPGAPDRGPDVLLVTLDTARADRFSYTGGSPVQTPNVDAIAAAGAGFTQAISHAPITLPAHASLLTGALPLHHGVRDNGAYTLSADHTTLAERLSAEGYRTGAFVGAAVLDARYGLAQGFDTYDDELAPAASAGSLFIPERRADAVVDAALAWLDAQPSDAPVHLWVHLFDPHAPYDPPGVWATRFAAAPYDGEIAYADAAIGRLVGGVASRRVGVPVVAVTADHGEALGAHGETSHGLLLHDATVRVPLVVSGPGVPAGRRISEQVEHVDLLPTLLALAGLDPAHGLDGRSLLPLLTASGAPPPRPVYVETELPWNSWGWAPLYGLRTPAHKLVRGASDELHDLVADPAEDHPLDTSSSALVGQLGALLHGAAERRTEGVDAATRAQLAALGYLTPDAVVAPPSDRSELLDPRTRARDADALSVAGALVDGGLSALALAALDDVTARNPDAAAPALMRAQLLWATGDPAGAIAATELATRRPSLADLLRVRATALAATGDLAGAAKAWGEVAAAADDPAALLERWERLREAGQLSEALEEARSRAGAPVADATVALLAEPGGVEVLAQVAERWPDDPLVARMLGEAQVAAGLDAEAALRSALAGRPDDERAAEALGRVLLARGAPADAVAALRWPVGRLARRPGLFATFAAACLGVGDLQCATWAALHAARREPGPLAPLVPASLDLADHAELLVLAGRPEEALDALGPAGSERSCPLEASGADPHAARLSWLRGRAQEQRAQVGLARAAYAEACAQDAGHAEACASCWEALAREVGAPAAARRARGGATPHAAVAAAQLAPLDLVGRVAALRQAQGAFPAAPAVEAALGDALAGAGRRDEAIAVYRRALASDPQHQAAAAGLARLLLAGGSPGAAAQILQSVLPSQPSAELQLLVAESGLALGQVAAAREALAHIAGPHLDMGGHTDLALAQRAARVAQHAWSAGARLETVQAYALAASWSPEDGRLAFNLGLALERMGAYPLAVVRFERALSLDPTLEAAREHLRALALQGK